MGVTSLGRHLRPACNQGLVESPLNKKTWFWPQYSVLWTSGFTAMSLPVTSSLLPSHARDLGTLWGIAASVRGSIQHHVFSNLWPPMRGDWGAVWGSRTHKLTLSPRLRRVWGSHRPIVCCFLIGRNGSSEQIDDVSNDSEVRHPKNNSPIVFSALWLVTT